MVVRATVQEVSQIGLETTEGTAPGTGANKRLLGLGFDIAEAAEFDEIRPMGFLPATSAPIRQNWSTISVSDGSYPCYNALAYLFTLLFGAPTTTTPSGATDARQHVWTPGTSSLNRKTATLQKGTSGSAEQVLGASLTDLSLSFSRTAAQSVDGSGFAQQIDYAATLTASPTDVPVVPILAGEVDVFLDDTGAALGTTKLTADFSADWSVGGLYSPAWVLNSALASYKEAVLQAPDMGVSLELGNDAVSRALVTDMRDGTSKFLRIQATGPEIESGQNYSLILDSAFQVNDAPSGGDVDGASTLTFGGRIVYDATWAKYTTITLVNSLATL